MKKTIKLFIVISLMLTLTGCTKYMKDSTGKILQNESTGQNLPSNILCKPTDSETLEIYKNYNEKNKKNKIDIDSLPECEDMSIVSKNYDGLWVTIFVQPLAWIIIKIGLLVKNYGLAIILCTLLIRGLVFPLTKKTAMQSENMKKAQGKLSKIEKKYQNRNDQASMMQKAQEIQMIYKEYNINPLSSCLVMFIQIPLFFAFYEAITRIPAIFEESFLGLNLETSPSVGLLKQGNILYLILIILVVLATYLSFKMSSRDVMSEEQAQQMKTMTYFMVVMMSITAFSISSGIAVYWVTSNIFTILQNIAVKRSVKNGRN
ncbi:MAG: YidC/Oxa1 family membrane protein insertase [Bacilli bacterium]|nr:YidC/Oxa1 family membrane protein insertase [Bacilli bacterium]